MRTIDCSFSFFFFSFSMSSRRIWNFRAQKRQISRFLSKFNQSWNFRILLTFLKILLDPLRSEFVLANVTEDRTVVSWACSSGLHATYSLLATSVTILSPVVNNAPHPATVRDGTWSRSKTMKQPASLRPETKFRDGRVAKYRANRRSTRTSVNGLWICGLWTRWRVISTRAKEIQCRGCLVCFGRWQWIELNRIDLVSEWFSGTMMVDSVDFSSFGGGDFFKLWGILASCFYW